MRSIDHKNAASVLPLPVGASMSVCRPLAMLAQPRLWTGVGPAKLFVNHVRAAGPNAASGSAATLSYSALVAIRGQDCEQSRQRSVRVTHDPSQLADNGWP